MVYDIIVHTNRISYAANINKTKIKSKNNVYENITNKNK